MKYLHIMLFKILTIFLRQKFKKVKKNRGTTYDFYPIPKI
jgi:hypothetical protein